MKSEDDPDWSKRWEVISDQPSSAGGQGKVSKVRRISDGALGALKELHPQHLDSIERRFRMQQEANALIALKGLGVPALLEANIDNWTDKGTPMHVIMAWIDGKPLSQEQARLSNLDSALKVVEQIMDTIDRCHALDIHHRDIKPDNVIIRPGSTEPVLVDFGMAWAKPANGNEPGFETPAGQELGNRFYRLPEYAPGQNTHDARSDVAMVVGLLFFMLAGVSPRQPSDEDGRMPHEAHADKLAYLAADPRWPRLQGVFATGFQGKIDYRFQSTRELRDRLSKLMPTAFVDSAQELRDELEAIKRMRETERGREVERIRTILRAATMAFDAKLEEAFRGSGYRFGKSGPDFSEMHDRLSHTLVPEGAGNPQASSSHLVRCVGAEVVSTINEGEVHNPREYYRGPTSDPQSLTEAAERQGRETAKVLAKIMREKYEKTYR